MRLSRDQVTEALARLSPAAKVIAMALAKTPEQRERIREQAVEVRSTEVADDQFSEVSQKLKDAPPVLFDVARQVRVFESYLQYVELRLPGVAIQRRRIAIPRKPADVPTTWTLAGILEAVALLPSNNQLIIASNATPFESREGHLRDRWPWQPFAYRGHLFSGA